jgi:hypothetical protein
MWPWRGTLRSSGGFRLFFEGLTTSNVFPDCSSSSVTTIEFPFGRRDRWLSRPGLACFDACFDTPWAQAEKESICGVCACECPALAVDSDVFGTVDQRLMLTSSSTSTKPLESLWRGVGPPPLWRTRRLLSRTGGRCDVLRESRDGALPNLVPTSGDT